jgi:hypothetical protein
MWVSVNEGRGGKMRQKQSRTLCIHEERKTACTHSNKEK